MVNLNTITGSLGVSSPQQAFRMVSAELTEPFKEVIASLSPSAIISSLSKETGLDEIAPTISAAMGDLRFEAKERNDIAKAQNNDFKKVNANLSVSKDVLHDINEKLGDIYSILSKEESAADIAERRQLRQQGSSGVPSIPINDTKKSLGFLGNLANFFGDARNLIGTGLIATATAGLGVVAGILKFFGRFALRAGAIATIFSALASLDRSDWENTFSEISEAIEKWKEGKYFESIAQFITSIGGLIKTALDNVINEFASFIESFGIKSEGAGILSSAAVGASLGMIFGPKGALVGAILGGLYGLYNIIKDINWSEFLEESGGFTEIFKNILKDLGNILIAKPLDLLKDMASWMSRKLGFDEFADILDQFNFKDLWSDIVDTFFTQIEKLITTISSFFTFDNNSIETLLKNSIFVNFGAWVWSKTFGLVLDFLTGENSVFKDPRQALTNLWNNSLFGNFVNWIWNKTFGSVIEVISSIFSTNAKEDVIKLINEKAPWLMHLGRWVYDTFIDPVIEVFKTIRDAAGNIREYALSFVPEWAKRFFGIDDEEELERMRAEEEARIQRDRAYALQEIRRQAQAETARERIRSSQDQSMSFDVDPSVGTWTPPAAAIRSRDITPETNTDRRQDPSTVVGNITVDQSVNNTRSGSDSYGPLTTRPKNSRLEDHLRGGIGTLDSPGY